MKRQGVLMHARGRTARDLDANLPDAGVHLCVQAGYSKEKSWS